LATSVKKSGNPVLGCNCGAPKFDQQVVWRRYLVVLISHRNRGQIPTELTAADYEITSDSTLKDNFEELPIAIFWGS